jgi:hypothetical protein
VSQLAFQVGHATYWFECLPKYCRLLYEVVRNVGVFLLDSLLCYLFSLEISWRCEVFSAEFRGPSFFRWLHFPTILFLFISALACKVRSTRKDTIDWFKPTMNQSTAAQGEVESTAKVVLFWKIFSVFLVPWSYNWVAPWAELERQCCDQALRLHRWHLKFLQSSFSFLFASFVSPLAT